MKGEGVRTEGPEHVELFHRVFGNVLQDERPFESDSVFR